MRLLLSLSRNIVGSVYRNGGALQQHATLYHTSQAVCAGQNWRLSHGQSRSGTEYGVLTNSPDWSYVDGRPAPNSKAQKLRKKRQSAINSRIRMLLSEMDKTKNKEDHTTTEDTGSEADEANTQTQTS